MKRNTLMLFLSLTAGLFLALPWMLLSSSPPPARAAPAAPATFTLFWHEDFSAPISTSTYYTTATPGSGIVSDTSFLLTQDASSQRGRIFYLTPTLMSDFTATFQLYLGGDSRGGDGIAFLFCPTYDYPPSDGSSMDASCPGGYIVAFQTYGSSLYTHLYIAQDETTHRVAATDIPASPGSWQTATVLFHAPLITVTFGDETCLDGVELPDYTPFSGYFGFSAATGSESGEHNEYRVDEIAIYRDRSVRLWAAPTFRQALPDEVVLYTVTLYNLTGSADNFALTLGEHQWPASLSQSATGIISDQQAVTFTVRVTVPHTLAQYEDRVTVLATSLAHPALYTDTVTLHTDARCRVRINNAPLSYPSIQAAVDAGHPSDLLKVAGYCTGINRYGGLRQVVYLSKTLTIQGGYTYTQWSQPNPLLNPTTVDAQGAGRVFFITGTTAPVLDGLKITGGDATDLPDCEAESNAGGGIYVHGAAAQISHCDIYSNVASTTKPGYGGGLYVADSLSTITGNTFHDNIAGTGQTGGGGGLYVSGGRASIIGNTFRNNTASTANTGYGGALYVANGQATINGNTLYDNLASVPYEGQGGGMYLDDSSATISGNTLQGNIASNDYVGVGGGITVDGSRDTWILNNHIISNIASLEGNFLGYGGNGGGIDIFSSDNIQLVGNIFKYNQAGHSAAGYGGGMEVESSRNIQIIDNTFEYNQAGASYEGQGGGLGLWRSTAITLDNNLYRFNTGSVNGAGEGGGIGCSGNSTFAALHNDILSNTASENAIGYGGGVYAYYCAPSFIGNLIQGNVASTAGEGYGGGASFMRSSDLALSNNTFLSNTATLSETATGEGGGLYLADLASARMENNLIARNAANTSGSALYLERSSSSWGALSALHTTVADNAGSAAISVSPIGILVMTNTIIAGHTVGLSVTASSTATMESTLWYANDVDVVSDGSYSHTHDYYSDPAFAAPEGGDYHLTAGSQAIDQGVEAGITEDIEGDPRPCGSAPDLGADEYRAFGVQLAPNRSDEANPGNSLSYLHTLTNTGNYTDTFLLTHSGERGWPASHPVTLTLAAGESRVFALDLSLPEGSGGLQERTTLTATSLASSAISATVVDTTTAHHLAALQLTADQATTATAGTQVTYTHTLTNSGNGPDTFALSHSSIQGWTATYPPTLALGYGQSTTFVITITIPADAVSGTVEATLLTVASQSDSSVQATVVDRTTAATNTRTLFLPLVLRNR